MFNTLRARLIESYFIFIIILAIAGGTIYVQQKNSLTELILNNSISTAELHAQNITTTLNAHIAPLQSIAISEDILSFDHELIFNRYKELIEIDELSFFTGAILYPNGKIYDMNGETNDVHDRQYYYDIFKDDVDYVISDAFIGKFRDLKVFIIAVPIYKDGKKLAALVAPLKLEDISKSLENVKLTSGSFGWLIDKNGLLIAHPNPDFILKLNVHDAEEKGFPGFNTIADNMNKNSYGIGEYHDSNQNVDKLLSYVTVPNTPGWRLGITTPVNELFDPLNQQITTLTSIIGLAILLSVMLSIAISSRIVKPIISLTNAVNHMSLGQLDTIEITNSGDELDTLITSFNNMSLELEDLSKNFEFKVGQRTKNLSEMNIYLNELATRDHLTNLYNRAFLMDLLENYVSETDSNMSNNISDKAKSFGLLFIDLNNFKYYNDTFGHDIGDEILIHSANFIKSRFRDSDIVTRYGGDEFVVVITDVSNDSFENITDQFKESSFGHAEFVEPILAIIDNVDVDIKNYLALAIGAHYYNPNKKCTIEELIQEADYSMYKHKAKIKGTSI